MRRGVWMRKKIKILLVLTILMTILTACQLNEGQVEYVENNGESIVEIDKTPIAGGQISLPLTSFSTLNPLMTENTSYYHFSKLIFESLFEFDKDLNIVNQLAESYNLSEDGRTIDIKLKDNVLWHDGEKLVAQDVLFTVNAIKYAGGNSIYKDMFQAAKGSHRPSNLRRIVDVKIIDERNLSIGFDQEVSNALEILSFPIVPSHVFGGLSNAAYARALELEDYTPVGTGPFKFEGYEKMKQVRLVANEDYRASRPYLDRIVGRVFDSEEDIVQAFETREVSLATTIGLDWEKYTQEDTIRSIEFTSADYEFLAYNFNRPIFQGEDGRSLRKAIAYAIDRQNIIEKIYLGHGTETDLPLHPDSWLLSEDAYQYGFNRDMAKRHLYKLDIEDQDGDGIYELDGEPISLRLVTNTSNPLRLETAKAIRQDLRQIGIDIEIYPEINEDREEWSKEEIENQWLEINGEIEKGNFDISLMGLQLSVIPDLSFAFHSSQIRDGMNFINYSDENMDALIEESLLNKSREEKALAYKNLQALIIKEIPYNSLLFKNKSLLLDSKIMGELEPSFFNLYKGIENLYIPKELQK